MAELSQCKTTKNLNTQQAGGRQEAGRRQAGGRQEAGRRQAGGRQEAGRRRGKWVLSVLTVAQLHVHYVQEGLHSYQQTSDLRSTYARALHKQHWRQERCHI